MSLNKKRNIIYLYSEVMPYTIAVMRALVQQHGSVIDCVHWDENKRTPFAPENEQGVTFHKRTGFDAHTLKGFIERHNPSIIYVVGRMDKLYLQMALQFRHKAHIVTGSDNQWDGSLKQKVAAVFSAWLYRRYFEYFWVPGMRQYTFAQKMGYPDTKIINHMLTADTAVFGNVYEQHKIAKQKKYPHNIVFAGRLTETKGIDLLVAAFNEAKTERNSDWQLTLIGSGDMQVKGNDHIKVKGFMSGAELAADCANWGIFCLPSRYEPWGVVVHEFAMCGLPMICSDAVGAGDALVMEGHNGYVFESGSKDALKKVLLRMMSKSDEELLLMSERSHELSNMQSPGIAADSLVSILNPTHAR
jgi:glycosyltransferase involved in cell wall biosynthesis